MKAASFMLVFGALTACQSHSDSSVVTEPMNEEAMASEDTRTSVSFKNPTDLAAAPSAVPVNNQTPYYQADDVADVDVSGDVSEGQVDVDVTTDDGITTEVFSADADLPAVTSTNIGTETSCGRTVIATSPGAVGDPCMTQEMVDAGALGRDESIAH